MFSIIAAYDNDRGIGKTQSIPWKCSQDLVFFKQLTKNNVVIMGRKTYESIGKPLSNRINIVITKTVKFIPDVIIAKSLEECCIICAKIPSVNYYVIGGSNIYKMFLESGLISIAYITRIYGHYNCDTFFPNTLLPEHVEIIEEKEGSYSIMKYTYSNKEEQAFLQLGKTIISQGIDRCDRTGTGTLSLFGQRLEFDLSKGKFPLLTSRKMFIRGIFEELMFYIRGQTDNNILIKKNVNVWTGNTTREFLDARGLSHLPVGDMGPSYGFLFRHFGAEYINCKTDYTGKGVDQLNRVLKLLKSNPQDRRIIISLWDPMNIDKCPLPPCLYNYQFYVANQKLSCMMTQRSSDFAIAGGWNVATGALLTILLAKVCNLEPEKLIWNIGDVHVYKNLINEFKIQITRIPYQFPNLIIPYKENIEDYEFSDINVIGYKSHTALNFKISI